MKNQRKQVKSFSKNSTQNSWNFSLNFPFSCVHDSPTLVNVCYCCTVAQSALNISILRCLKFELTSESNGKLNISRLSIELTWRQRTKLKIWTENWIRRQNPSVKSQTLKKFTQSCSEPKITEADVKKTFFQFVSMSSTQITSRNLHENWLIW